MKKKLCMLLLGLCLVSLSACGNKETSGNPEDIPVAEAAVETDSDDSVKEQAGIEDEEEGDKIVSEDEKERDAEDRDTEEKDTEDEDAGGGNAGAEKTADGMRPEFKEAMDSYEAFYDEYCAFMKEYSENSSDLGLLSKYTELLQKSNEMTEKFEAWDEEEMNEAELKYYLDVNNRVMQKLLAVSG